MQYTYKLALSFFFCAMTLAAFSQSANSNGRSKNKVNSNSNKPSKNVTTMEYHSRVYNECVPEYVDLTGTVTYSIKEVNTADRYFIIYKIDLRKVTGKGEVTGNIYKGGGVIMNKVNANFKTNHTVGNDHYQVKYRSKESDLIFSQKAHFVSTNGEQKVSFNDIGDKCTTK